MPESPASVRFVTAWGVTVGAAALVLGLSACSGGSDAGSTTTTTTSSRPVTTTTSSTAPERPTSTTTTMYDPAAVEGQVEAAYLASWDVYADAVYDLELDDAALAEVFAEEALDLRRTEIRGRIDESRASLVHVEHSYEVVVADTSTAYVVDNFVNHQVLIDSRSKEPLEPDPNERLLVSFRLKLIDGAWRVVFIEKVNT